MTPSLYDATTPATADEWHLCNELGKDQCLSTLNSHWSTFYTRDDFVEIQQAGLTAVRIPLGYWAVDLLDYEPYVSGQYPYLIQAVQWAGQLGLKVLIDIHGAPGSQNGWEETGLVGAVGFTDNTTNTDRTLNVLQNLTTEFSKSEYGGVVTNIELLNEPTLALDTLKVFYTLGAAIVAPANSSGINVTINDGFFEPHTWANYDPNNADATSPAPYLTVDTHQFWAFAPFLTYNEDEILQSVCTLGAEIKQMANVSGIPPTLVGEWSLSTGITANSTTDASLDQTKRNWFRKLFEAQNAAFTPNTAGQSSIGWYFWAWKTEYDIDAWSYRKGVSYQYIPSNVSDPSTYFYPLLSDGCIDTSGENYTSPATVTAAVTSLGVAPTSTGTSTGTPTGTSTASAGSSTTSAKSSAAGLSVNHGLWLVLAFAMFSIC